MPNTKISNIQESQPTSLSHDAVILEIPKHIRKRLDKIMKEMKHDTKWSKHFMEKYNIQLPENYPTTFNCNYRESFISKLALVDDWPNQGDSWNKHILYSKYNDKYVKGYTDHNRRLSYLKSHKYYRDAIGRKISNRVNNI